MNEKGGEGIIDSQVSIKPVGRLIDDLSDGIESLKNGTYYTLGIRKPGDTIVGFVGSNRRFNTPKNVTITLTYPRNGEGALVTYVATLMKAVRRK